MNIRLSHSATLEVTPSRTVSSLQYERLIEVNSYNEFLMIIIAHFLFLLLKEFRLNAHSYYTLKVNFKHRLLQDYVMTSIPMVLISMKFFRRLYSCPIFSVLLYKHNFNIRSIYFSMKMVILSVQISQLIMQHVLH